MGFCGLPSSQMGTGTFRGTAAPTPGGCPASTAPTAALSAGRASVLPADRLAAHDPASMPKSPSATGQKALDQPDLTTTSLVVFFIRCLAQPQAPERAPYPSVHPLHHGASSTILVIWPCAGVSEETQPSPICVWEPTFLGTVRTKMSGRPPVARRRPETP